MNAGIFLTVPMLSSIPMSEYNLEQSKIFNRKEIMNETKRKTGAYYAH